MNGGSRRDFDEAIAELARLVRAEKVPDRLLDLAKALQEALDQQKSRK
jgi:hypothetical protein